MPQFKTHIALVDPNLTIFSLSFSSSYPDGEVVGPMVDPNLSRRNFFLYLFTGNILHFFTFFTWPKNTGINRPRHPRRPRNMVRLIFVFATRLSGTLISPVLPKVELDFAASNFSKTVLANSLAGWDRVFHKSSTWRSTGPKENFSLANSF